MKNIIIFLICSFPVVLNAQTISNRTINTNENHSGTNLTVNNVRVTNNAIVTFTGTSSIVIENFSNDLGTTVTISTGSSLRSAVSEEYEFEEEGTTALNEVFSDSKIAKVIVYSVMGMPVYSSFQRSLYY